MIKLNGFLDDIYLSPYSLNRHKGLRHRDSLSPVLFDLVVDALAIIMNDT
jgi:hypothetical protein